jgi:Predicted membrane protein
MYCKPNCNNPTTNYSSLKACKPQKSPCPYSFYPVVCPVQLLIPIIIITGALTAFGLGKLTAAGALAGAILAWLLYQGAGITGLCMLAVFFITGVMATAMGYATKRRLGIAENNKGRRTAGQVLANGGMAGAAGALAWCFPQQVYLWQPVAAAALSSACADTLSSELGSLYGKQFYNILTFKKDTRGLDGVVSLEGFLCGLAGSALIAMIYSAGYGYTGHALWIIAAGTAGNLADSLLGAKLERKGILSNNLVNALNTLIAALAILLLMYF